MSQLPLVERSIDYFNEPAIIAALRVFPQGASALFVAFFIPRLLQKVRSARIPLAGGMIVAAAMYLLIIFNDGKLRAIIGDGFSPHSSLEVVLL